MTHSYHFFHLVARKRYENPKKDKQYKLLYRHLFKIIDLGQCQNHVCNFSLPVTHIACQRWANGVFW